MARKGRNKKQGVDRCIERVERMMMPLGYRVPEKTRMPARTQLTPHPANPPTTTTDARHIFGCGNPRGAVSVRREFVEPRPPLPQVDLLPPIPILPATPDIAFLRLVLQIARDVLGEPFSRFALGYPMSSTPSTSAPRARPPLSPPTLTFGVPPARVICPCCLTWWRQKDTTSTG